SPAARKKRRRDAPIYYLMGAPALFLFLAFYLYPALQNIRYATRRWDGISEPESVGFGNFINLLTNDDLFYKTLGNNLEFTFLVVLFQTTFSLLFAVYLVNNSRVNVFLRTLYFFPTILSSVSVGMIWLFLYDPNFGAINLFFNRVGLNSFALNWLGSETSALYAIAFTQVWFHTGQMMVVYIAGLQQIPKELYESAQVDGASRWKQFRHVTWPMAMPTTVVVMAYTTIQSFRAFDLIMVMTNSTAGPNNSTNIFTTLVYLTLFNELRLGYAAAQTIFMVATMLLITWIQRRTLGRRYEK
ncbi:MAG: carbohydrate ABC transporter permease, partial [Actinomycetota bacterium]